MSVKDSQNNIWLFWVDSFNKRRFQFIFLRCLGHYNIYMIDDWQCKGYIPPAQVSVGVNSKEYLWRFRLFNKDNIFLFLFHFTAIMSNFFLVQLKRCWRSSKFLLREHAFIWNKLFIFVRYFNVMHFINVIIFRWSNSFWVITIFLGSIVELVYQKI